MNITLAADSTVHEYKGGSESLGPMVGISPAVLRNKVNPNNTTHHLTLAEADRLMRMSGDTRILNALAHAHGFLLVKAPDSCTTESDMSVLEHITSLMVAQGQYAREIHESLADGGLDPEEMRRIDKLGGDLMTEVAEVNQRLRGMVG